MALRKLQTEMDRTFKRVEEGIVEFCEIWVRHRSHPHPHRFLPKSMRIFTASSAISSWSPCFYWLVIFALTTTMSNSARALVHPAQDKVYSAPSPALKEKHEGDLKKEIKKLQRYRDDIKKWATSSEIKNKDTLYEWRRKIEEQMERFKICEKETKTKAFSKEGLAAASKKDPNAAKKAEIYEWIEEFKGKLEEQIETYEAELEEAGGAKKGGKGKVSAKAEKMQHALGRNAWHIEQLDSVSEALRNDKVTCAQVAGLKDDIEMYIEQNQEPDFFEDEFLYDELDLAADDDESGSGSGSDSGSGSGSDDGDASDDDQAQARASAKAAASAAAAKAPAAAAAKVDPKAATATAAAKKGEEPKAAAAAAAKPAVTLVAAAKPAAATAAASAAKPVAAAPVAAAKPV